MYRSYRGIQRGYYYDPSVSTRFLEVKAKSYHGVEVELGASLGNCDSRHGGQPYNFLHNLVWILGLTEDRFLVADFLLVCLG